MFITLLFLVFLFCGQKATKKEAIDKVRTLLANLIASGEIIQVEADELAFASLDEPLP